MERYSFVSIKPVKSLGQSFLIHEKTADKLVSALELQPTDTVVEIGAGKGILTSRIIPKAKLVIAIEIDSRLVNYLNEKFSQADNLQIVHTDFLKFDLKRYQRLKIIANLPYYMSSAILWKLLDNFNCWEIAVLTAQREFARRLLATSGSNDYCPLAVFCEYHCERQRLFNIPPAYFKPRPKIVSSAFRLVRHQPTFQISSYPKFIPIVFGAFTPQPRKLLINNLARSLKINRNELIRIFNELNLPLNIRAAEVNLKQFIQLANALTQFVY